MVQRQFLLALSAGIGAAKAGCLSPDLVCDGSADDTVALQASIDACAAAGEPLVLPSGQTCVTGPLQLRAGLDLKMHDAKLRAGAKWSDPDLHFLTCESGCHDLAISGGEVDAQGSQWWKGLQSDSKRPHLLVCDCKDVLVENVTFRDAARFFMVVHGQRWTIRNVMIRSPGYLTAPNTDGIQISAQDVHVSNCDVENGDDSIVMKPGARRVLVEDSRVAQGNGLVVGTGGDVHDVVFRRCIVDGTQYGCHIKAKGEQVGEVSNITFEDIEVKSVQNKMLLDPWYSIGINQNGQTLTLSEQRPALRSSVKIHDITFRNISCSGSCGGNPNPFAKKLAGKFTCNTGDLVCSNITLENVELEGGCSFENVFGTGTAVTPSSCTPPSLHSTPIAV